MHRDVALRNFLLSKDMRVVVCDYGTLTPVFVVLLLLLGTSTSMLGLSRELSRGSSHGEYYYKPKHGGALPTKWYVALSYLRDKPQAFWCTRCAPETLKSDMKCTTKSVSCECPPTAVQRDRCRSRCPIEAPAVASVAVSGRFRLRLRLRHRNRYRLWHNLITIACLLVTGFLVVW